VDQDIATVTCVDRSLNRIRVAGAHDPSIRHIEAISVTFHRVFRCERSDGDLFVLIYDSRLDFVRVHFPAVRGATSVTHRSVGIGACLDVELAPGQSGAFAGCHAGSPSMIGGGPDVGITRVSRKPAFRSKSLKSDSVRSRPPSSTSIFKSVYFRRSGSLGGFNTHSTRTSLPSERIARRQLLRICRARSWHEKYQCNPRVQECSASS
jgi:hypothetical protein